MPEHITHIKYVRASAKKMRFIVDDVKRKKPAEVIDMLEYLPGKSAFLLRKAIKSAVSGAQETAKIDRQILRFKKIDVDEGPVLKRFRAGSKGMAKPYRKPSTHIKIILSWKSTKKSKDEKAAGKPAVKKSENKSSEKEVKSLRKSQVKK